MTVALYQAQIQSAQELYKTTSADLAGKTTALENNIKSLTDISAKKYDEIKDDLKVLNQEMLTFYPTMAPTAQAARQSGMNAIAETQKTLRFLNELSPLSETAIEHLVRHGHNKEALQKNETVVQDAKVELTGNVRSLNEAIVKIESLQIPFMVALNNTLKIQAAGESTITWKDSVASVVTYRYLNTAIAAKTVEVAPPVQENVEQVTDAVSASTNSAAPKQQSYISYATATSSAKVVTATKV